MRQKTLSFLAFVLGVCASIIIAFPPAAKAEDILEFCNTGQSEWCKKALTIPFQNSPVSGQIAGAPFKGKEACYQMWWPTSDKSYSRTGEAEYGKKYHCITITIYGTKPHSISGPRFEFTLDLSELPKRKTVPLPHRKKGDKLNVSSGGVVGMDARNESVAGRLEIMPMDAQKRLPCYICVRSESSVGKSELNGYFYAVREP